MRKHMQRSLFLLAIMLLVLPTLVVGRVQAESDEGAELAAFAPRNLDVRLQGAGASFPDPLYQRLLSDYKNVVSNVKITYQAIGSSGGISNFTGGLTDFGGTDAVIGSDKFTGEELHVPMVMGPVVATYRVDGIGRKSLRFTGEILTQIFAGTITKWNDPKIVAENPGRDLPNLDILVVYRSDGSGTSSIFTSYLAAIDSANFTATTNFEPPASNRRGGERNSGVADVVGANNGAIGYVEYTYAATNRLAVPWIKNKAGNYIRPSLVSTSFAAAGATYPADLRMSIVNPDGEKAYPIAGFTWLLVHENKYTDLKKAQAVVDYIYWTLEDAQQKTHKRMGYSPLPSDAKVKSIEQLCKVTVGGTKAMDGNGATCP